MEMDDKQPLQNNTQTPQARSIEREEEEKKKPQSLRNLVQRNRAEKKRKEKLSGEIATIL